MLQCYNVTMLPIAYVTMNMLHSHQHPRGQSFLAYIMYVTMYYNVSYIYFTMLNLSPLFGVAYGSERSLHPLHLVSRSSFVSKVKQSDGCRPKPCKWSPPQWVEAKISRTRIATRHNAAQSQDWWRNVQRAQNDASLKLKLPYKGFSGASCQLSLACGAQCQYCQCNECPLQVPECQISLGAQCQYF